MEKELIYNNDQYSGPFKMNSVICADVLDALPRIPDNSFDLCIADPPYNLSKGNNWKWDNSIELPGFGGDWSKVMQEWDNMTLSEYFQFTAQWLREIKRIVKPSGSVWIHGTYHNIGIINFILQLLEIEMINEVVWFKRNSFPNLSGRRLTASHETIIWAHTGNDRKYQFNYDDIKKLEFPEDKIHQTGKQMRTVWDIPNNKTKDETKFGKHPTQKPLRLLRRMLMISSEKNQKCLIPFAGAGSECVACIEHGLDFLAFEIDPKYVQIAKKRIDESCFTLFPNSCQRSINMSQENAMVNEDDDISEKEFQETGSIPSLIKWTGSKRLQAHEIKSHFPEYKRYFEPFLGGGSLLFLNCDKESIASDIYEPLMKLWILVRDNLKEVIESYKENWIKLNNNLPDYYYEIRERFNKNHDPLDLLFLTRTCVNGIVRFNKNGGYNNSFHLSRKGMSPDNFSKIACQWSEKIRNVRFECQNYQTILEEAKSGDFVYMDPPYAGSKQRYIENIDLDKFLSCLQKLNSKGVKYALSFDGFRNGVDLRKPIPEELYKRQVLIHGGNSAVKKVLDGKIHKVDESLYLNY